MPTIAELKEFLYEHYDPDEIIELLGIDSVTLVEIAENIIETNYDRLSEEFKSQAPELGGEGSAD